MNKERCTALSRRISLALSLAVCVSIPATSGCESSGTQSAKLAPAQATGADSEARSVNASVPTEGNSAPALPQIVSVTTAAAAVAEVDEWIGVPIHLAPYRRAFPAAEGNGRITSVNFEVGDAVKDGTVLVQLDDSVSRLEVTRDEAALERGKVFAEECAVVLGKAERDVSRLEALAEGGQASEGDLDSARVALAAARSQVAQARNDLLSLESTLRASRRAVDRMAVKAPFSGVIVSKKVEMGGWADTGSAVAELIDVATLEATVRIPETLVYAVSENATKARVRVPFAGVEVETPIVRVVREITGPGRSFSAWLRLENKDSRLVPGMEAICFVPTGAKVAALTIPIEAVAPGVGGERDHVLVVRKDAVSKIPLKRWYSFDGKAVLVDRVVEPGTRIIVQGAENIPQDARRVRVKEEGSANESASPDAVAPKLDSRKPE